MGWVQCYRGDPELPPHDARRSNGAAKYPRHPELINSYYSNTTLAQELELESWTPQQHRQQHQEEEEVERVASR